MKNSLLKLGLLAALAAISTSLVLAQVTATGSISGSVFDPSGGVIPGAEIQVKNTTTGQEFTTVTAENGTFVVPALASDVYSVTATMPGFKQVIVNNVKVDVGTPASVKIKLEVGEPTESVIVMGGAQVLQTQTATVATTIIGRQITDLPFVSRDALDLVLLLPGTSTAGRPRQSTVNGLPKSTLNITIDGVNVQDSFYKSQDGFFTYIRPRLDAVEEVTLSTASPGAESAGEGAVQVRFVTRGGDNELHGSVYWYHRNPALNANYWFNNRDRKPNPVTGRADRERILLNQPGVRVGGPIIIPGLFDGRDRAFFFVNYEEYRLPESYTRNRTILSPEAQQGIFRYNTASGVKSVNLLALAAANNQTSTADPTIAKLLGDIQKSLGNGQVQPLTDPNLQNFTFTNIGNQTRRFPTLRLDFNITEKHHLEHVWNYQRFASVVDFLNSVDPAFPGMMGGAGSQGGHRFSDVTALRSTITPTLVNEARFGLTGGTTLWRPEVCAGQFGYMDGFALGISAAGISNGYVSRTQSRRNSPVKQFSDTLTWTKGTHTANFGFNFSNVGMFYEGSTVVPYIGMGVAATDPAKAMFVAANFDGASGADITRAENIYAVLTGRATSIQAVSYLGEKSNKYDYLGLQVQRAHMREMGLFAQDSWRWKPNLTLTYGLRWEVQFPFTALNNGFSTTSFDQLWGISGAGNIFKPGTQTGKETEFVAFEEGSHAYDVDYNNFAPSVGFAWSPNWQNGVLRKIFGSGSESVIRGGYSIAFNREGTNVFTSILGSNPGGSITADRSVSIGNLGTLPVLFRDKSRLGPPTDLLTEPIYPMTGTSANSVNVFSPNLQLGYAQSWSFGLQRELNKNTVLEVRYVGNRGIKLWRQYNINETNVVENKFLDEFKLAMANLQANNAAGGSRANSFAYFGPNTGTSPLPIMLAFFSGKPATQAGDAALYTSSNFKSSTFVTPLYPNNPNPIGFADSIMGVASMRTSGIAAGLPANFFRVNPGKLGGAWIVDNGGASSYNGLTFELRRRMSQGLLVQGSYAFSKSLSNMYDRDGSTVVAAAYRTLRHPGLSKTITPYDIRHGFKANWIYELPFGHGKPLLPDAGGLVDRLVGGWEFHGAARLQSGSPFNFGNVSLVGMTLQELREAVKIRHDDANKITYFLPQDIIDNTRFAYNVTASGYPAGKAPSGRYISPASNGSCIQSFNGQCGFANVVLYGPRFTRFDLSAVKKVLITEGVDFEFRAEFLNAFNHINFMVGPPNSDTRNIGGFSSATFGQTRDAYQDLSTTNDPGGRLIQFVARINF